MKAVIRILLFTVLLSGCAGKKEVFVSHIQDRFPSGPSDVPIVLTYSDKLDLPYEEIGAIFVSTRSRFAYEQVAQSMKDQARKVGADAVIKLQYKERQVFAVNPFFVSIAYNVATGEGIAVRYRNKPTDAVKGAAA